jgi:Ca2+-transporting ATPase
MIAAPTGLSSEEADLRLTTFGKNVLPKDRSKTILSLVLRQFASPLIYILIFAAIVSFAIGEVVDGGFIVLVLMINGTVGIVQECIASRAIDKLLV